MMLETHNAATTRHFSTNSAPEAMRAQFFQKEMQALFAVGLSVKSSEEKPLTADVTGYFGRNLRFAAIRFSPHSTVSTRSANSPKSRLLVSLHKQGVAVVSQGGRESRIEAGDIFVIDPARPFHIEASEIYVHSVYLKPCVLRQLLPQLDSLTALAIRCEHGSGAILRSVLDGLFSMTHTMSEEIADDMSDALPYLLAPALRSLEQSSDKSTSRLKALHRQRISRFVRENLWDCTMDANAIARGVNLSPRHVYELFSDDDKPLMKSVWSERLTFSRRDLAEQRLRAKTVGEIAYAWGFSNVSHFSRAFKTEFGIGPREFRKSMQRNTNIDHTAPLATH